MNKSECISHFFGMCVRSSEHAEQITLKMGVGTAAGIGLIALAFGIAIVTTKR